MPKSKCTCKHRLAVHVRNASYPHEPECYYFTKLKEESKARQDREDVQRLYRHYRDVAKGKSNG